MMNSKSEEKANCDSPANWEVTQNRCGCWSANARAMLFEFGPVTLDDHHGEVTVLRCRECGTRWLHYFLEYEGFMRSGRWYRGFLPADQVRQVQDPVAALNYLAGLPWYFRGGSFFGGAAQRSSGFLNFGH